MTDAPITLSYTGFTLWEKQPEEYYLQYLAKVRPPRSPQTQAASIGSAFDAYVKSSLHRDLGGMDEKKSFAFLFEAQVEEHNRDWAKEEGKYVFDQYVEQGWYDHLLTCLSAASSVEFEFELAADIQGVPFKGFPDLRYITPGSTRIIHDWKVNGYCSKSAKSPEKGYRLCGDLAKALCKPHKLYEEVTFNDVAINKFHLNETHKPWADQLSLYAWASGEEVGSPTVLSVHQIVAKPNGSRPILRTAVFSAVVDPAYQLNLVERFKRCWEAISSGHIFLFLSREDSDLRCEQLEKEAEARCVGNAWFNEVSRAPYRG